MKLELELTPFDSATLVYGAPVKKSFAAWGIDQNEITGAFREQVADELNLTLPGQALTVAQFPYRSKIKVTIDEAPFFAGYVTDDPRAGDGFSNRSSVAVAGPWWFFENLVYQQAQDRLVAVEDGAPVYVTNRLTQFTLNLPLTPNFQSGVINSVYYTVTLLDSRAQIAAVLDYAIAQGAWLAYDLAAILAVPVLPADVLNITCAEAIRRQLEDVDAVAWFDHTQSPPRFHCQRRKDLPSYMRTLGNKREVQGFQLKRRYDLAVPYVLINFQEPYAVGNISTIQQVQDLYPNPKPADELKALITTVPLRGVNGTLHTKFIKTEAMNPATLAWWQRRKPELDPEVNPNAAIDYADVELLDGTANRVLTSGTGDLPNMIVDGGYSDFMGGAHGDEEVTVQAKYHRRFDVNRKGTRVSAHTWRARCRTTSLNFPAGVNYTFTEFTSLGENINSFLGIAQIVYEDLNAPQWEGNLPLFELNFSGEVIMGKNINLANGLEEWTTMNALVREISFRVNPGGIFYRVSVGPNKKLTPGMVADRLRAARSRYVTAVNFGSGGTGTSVRLTRHTGSDASSTAEPMHAEQSAIEADPGSTNAGAATMSGGAGYPYFEAKLVKPDGTKDATFSDFVLKIRSAAKLADGTGGTDGVGGAIDSLGHRHTLEVYQLTTCEDDGTGALANYTRLFVCSDRFKLAGQ